MRKAVFLILAIVLLSSHDLYLKMDTYFLQPNEKATISLYNGTFEKSENIITRDRITDASVVVNGSRTAIDSSAWTDQDSTITQLHFTAGDAGTYVTGVSTKPRGIELTAAKFNNYLEHDGVLDMLAQRKTENTLDQNAIEQYAKHVKTIYQVGEKRTSDWNTVLGYPIEFVPQENPYLKYTGDDLKVQLLMNGKPLVNQLVFAHQVATAQQHSHDNETSHSHDNGNEHSHSHENESHSHDGEPAHSHDENTDEGHSHTDGQQLRTDDQGMVTVNLPEDGLYYLRTIHMVNSPQEEFTHVSNWATLTWEVTHKHDATTHTHDHDNDHEDGIPSWVFWVGSFVLIGILFLVFRKKAA